MFGQQLDLDNTLDLREALKQPMATAVTFWPDEDSQHYDQYVMLGVTVGDGEVKITDADIIVEALRIVRENALVTFTDKFFVDMATTY